MFRRLLIWFDTPRGSVVFGVIVGVALALFSVALGALFFRVYAYGVFMVAPFFIGLASGYLINRRVDMRVGRTLSTISWITLLCGVALMAAALEGAVCIVMAAPLAFVAAILGALIGRWWVRRGRAATPHAFVGFAVLPVFFAVESMIIGTGNFGAFSSIEVEADESRVWTALLAMGNIREEPALAFRLGVSYPLGAEIKGAGVGAIRYGRFSTGTAVERVTAWQPGRELALQVLSEPPAMREFSPYAHVHAPHVHGYFTTRSFAFRLEPLAGGRTHLVLESDHSLRLEPRVYWMELARLAIEQNYDRVLRHIKREAEAVH
jgi:hypothetical protein